MEGLLAAACRIALSVVALLVATLPVAAAECGPLKMMASLAMRPLRDGRMAVAVKLMDRPSLLLLDTGGALRGLNERTVHELGLPEFNGRMSLRNVKGQVSDAYVTVPTLTLGGFVVPKVRFIVLPGDDGSHTVASTGADGVFSPDLLHGVDFDFDFGAGKFNIFSTDHCAGRVVYWPSTMLAVVPFDIDRTNHITFPVKLDGKMVHAVLDTGATRTTLDLGLAESHFDLNVNSPDVQKIGEVNSTHPIYRHQFKSLAVEGLEVTNPMIELLPNMLGPAQDFAGSHISDSSTTLPDMLMGMSMLRKLHIYIAYKERKLYITAASPPPLPAAAAPATDAPPPP